MAGHSVDPLAKSKSADEASKDALLLKHFPRHVAEALRDGRKVEPEPHDCATVFFSKIVGFNEITSKLTPEKVSNMMDRLYTEFDDALCVARHVFKVETVGDAYMTVTNVATEQKQTHALAMAQFAFAAIEAAFDEDNPALGLVQIRVGVHSGPVITNVVGIRSPLL